MPPALPPTALLQLQTLVRRNVTGANNGSAASHPLQVVCAFPVSGQYGPGSRVLYYVLIAACVFVRRLEWLRKACLAGALLFPAVAALHGIVLAAVHLDSAVDMDVYGAFQLCSIGILVAPVTVRLSQTYFNDPGRNTIFVWTVLIISGMLALTVEFFRITTSPCTQDNSGNPISSNPKSFPYNSSPNCNLTCNVSDGPFSPIRKGSANNIYVIPAPDRFTFGTATLLAAGCCIPAILSLIYMWNKILEINWKAHFGSANEVEPASNQGREGPTAKELTRLDTYIKKFLKVVEIPVHGAAVLLILVLGEWNFFSYQVNYQSEPIESIGQWAPIVGTALAVLGSLSIFLAKGLEAVKEETSPNPPSHRRTPSMHEVARGVSPASSHSVATPSAMDVPRTLSNGGGRTSGEIVPTISRAHTWYDVTDVGNRRRVARALIAFGDRLGTAAPDQFDDSGFKHGKAVDFPEIPGEEQRNSALSQIRDRYNQSRDEDGNVTPGLRRQHSRAGSFTGSDASGPGVKGGSITPRAASPRRPHANTLPTERTSSELQNTLSYSSASSSGGRIGRRDTLEVPSPVHHSHTRNNLSTSSVTSVVTIPKGQSSPTIVVSSDRGSSSSTHTPVSNPPQPSSPLEPPPTP